MPAQHRRINDLTLFISWLKKMHRELRDGRAPHCHGAHWGNPGWPGLAACREFAV
jgi:hypothetical protein